MAHSMITVRIKLLNGDLIEIPHNPSRGFWWFQHLVYEACPSIPSGCLLLQRIPLDVELDEEFVQWMSLYAEEEKEENVSFSPVTKVYDGDLLFAIVDPSRVRPILIKDPSCILHSHSGKDIVYLDDFTVHFLSNEEFDEDTRTSRLMSHVSFFFDEKRNLFAWKNTFEAPTLQEMADNYSSNALPLYSQTPSTIWFSSITECLLSIPNARFPIDPVTLSTIAHQISSRDWLDESYCQEDDEVDSYDLYDNREDLREEYYEQHIRWAHE